jgi:hypothetical protein
LGPNQLASAERADRSQAKPAPVSVPDNGSTMVGPMFFNEDTFSVGNSCGENGCCSPWESFQGRPSCFRLSLGYLLWIIKDSNVPPLAATSPVGTPQSLAGVIGAPGTRVIYGGGEVDHNALSGGKFTLGFDLPWWQDWSFETSYFFVGRRVNEFSDASSVLARPITNIRTGNNESILVNYPGVFAGNINIEDRIRLWGVDAYFRKPIVGGQGWLEADWLVGYRYLELEQNLNITQQRNGLAGAPAGQVNVSSISSDRFGTRNQFNGLTLGIETECRWRRWTLGTSYKISLGNVHQTLHVEGSQVFIPGVTTQSIPSGILALPSNIGSYSRDSFTVVPEFGLKLGLNITQRLQLYVGYSFLYFGNVMRPGDQIDTDINRTQIVVPGSTTTPSGAARPIVPFRTTDFWAQGANFGLEFRY